MADIYTPPALEYNPIQGELVLIEYLASGRPILIVELPNHHRIRAIMNNDDIHSDSLPTIGSHVECIQSQGIWSYVRTLDVLQGRAAIGVLGAGMVVTYENAHLYSTPNRFLGLSENNVLLNGPANQIRMTTTDMELSAVSSGLKLGIGLYFTGGRTNTPSVRTYEPVVGRSDALLNIDSGAANPADTETADLHTHAMPHVHLVDYRSQLKLGARFNIDDALVDTDATIPIDPQPVTQDILDSSFFKLRVYNWEDYTDAIWYNVRWLYGVLTTRASIGRALSGNYGQLSQGLLATLVEDGAFGIQNIPIREPFRDDDRGIGRELAKGHLVSSAFTGRTILQIEVIGFQVQAQLDNPLRPTPWSEPYYIFYVDWQERE